MSGTRAYDICCSARMQALACVKFLRRQGLQVNAAHHVAGQSLPWHVTVHIETDASAVDRLEGEITPHASHAPQIDLLRQVAQSVGARLLELKPLNPGRRGMPSSPP